MPATTDLLDLLRRRRELDSGSAGSHDLDREIVALLEVDLREDLRRILLSQGARIQPEDASRRFTELLHGFILRVLEHSPPGLTQVQTRTELLAYVTRALSNMLLDHCRRKQRQQTTAISQLAELREGELAADCPDARLDMVLEQLDSWDGAGDRERLWAQAVRYYYVVGMRPEQIDRQLRATEKVTLDRLGQLLGVSRSKADRLLKEALCELRKVFE